MRFLNILLGHLVVFGIALGVSSSCSVNYPTTAFRCSPFDSDPCPAGGGYQCCSDDPAALDFTDIGEFVTPNYQGRGGEGVPIFSGGNNPLSKTGMCIKTGSVAPAFALADINAQGCPVPCNPTWSANDISSVCGQGTFCCQTVELEQEDCIFDGSCYRPVTGGDIVGVGGSELSNWSPTLHATHQDPSGLSCEVFVNGLIPSGILGDNNLSVNDALRACYRRLTVANQRGFCLGGPGVLGCPLAQPTYVDACEELNLANGLAACL